MAVDDELELGPFSFLGDIELERRNGDVDDDDNDETKQKLKIAINFYPLKINSFS